MKLLQFRTCHSHSFTIIVFKSFCISVYCYYFQIRDTSRRTSSPRFPWFRGSIIISLSAGEAAGEPGTGSAGDMCPLLLPETGHQNQTPAQEREAGAGRPHPLPPCPPVNPWSQVAVFRVDDVQGKEFRALLLSTVRTCYARDDDDLEEDAGFLTNPKVWFPSLSLFSLPPMKMDPLSTWSDC